MGWVPGELKEPVGFARLWLCTQGEYISKLQWLQRSCSVSFRSLFVWCLGNRTETSQPVSKVFTSALIKKPEDAAKLL